MYPEVDYARTRLDNTIVQDHGGKALYIHNIDSDRVVRGVNSSGNNVVTGLDDCKLTQHKLGFVNVNGRVLYLVRQPKRRDWRQGLRDNNVKCYILGRRGMHNVSNSTIMNCIDGSFPSVELAVEAVTASDLPVAISRSFALVPKRGGICLQYKHRGIVGVYKDGEFTLSDKYNYLQNSLNKEVG